MNWWSMEFETDGSGKGAGAGLEEFRHTPRKSEPRRPYIRGMWKLEIRTYSVICMVILTAVLLGETPRRPDGAPIGEQTENGPPQSKTMGKSTSSPKR